MGVGVGAVLLTIGLSNVMVGSRETPFERGRGGAVIDCQSVVDLDPMALLNSSMSPAVSWDTQHLHAICNWANLEQLPCNWNELREKLLWGRRRRDKDVF